MVSQKGSWRLFTETPPAEESKRVKVVSSSNRALGYFASLGQNTPNMSDSDLPDHSSTSIQRYKGHSFPILLKKPFNLQKYLLPFGA
jgi:hypothetical protein